jgi:hypothetical protein
MIVYPILNEFEAAMKNPAIIPAATISRSTKLKDPVPREVKWLINRRCFCPQE